MKKFGSRLPALDITATGTAALVVVVVSLPPKSASKSSKASVVAETVATLGDGPGPGTSRFCGRESKDALALVLALAWLAVASRSKPIPSLLRPLLVNVPVTLGGFFVSPAGNEPKEEKSLRIPALADEDSEEEEVPDDGNDGDGRGGSGGGMTPLLSPMPHSPTPRLLTISAPIGRV